MSKIVHTAFISENPRATADFFGKLLGWKIENMASPGMEYFLWNYPGEKDGGGGIGRSSEDQIDKSPHVNIFVDVDNLGEALSRAKSLGATQIWEETEIPNNMGYFLVLEIPGGIKMGLWSKQPSMKHVKTAI